MACSISKRATGTFLSLHEQGMLALSASERETGVLTSSQKRRGGDFSPLRLLWAQLGCEAAKAKKAGDQQRADLLIEVLRHINNIERME